MAIEVAPSEPVLKVEEIEGGPELVAGGGGVEVEDETESVVCTEDVVRTVGTISL